MALGRGAGRYSCGDVQVVGHRGRRQPPNQEHGVVAYGVESRFNMVARCIIYSRITVGGGVLCEKAVGPAGGGER